MLKFLSRPSRRPRTVRRITARPPLRVEALETRANPSAPAPSFVAVQTRWSDPNDVVITGTVADANPATTFISATSAGSVAMSYANAVGGFQVSLHIDGSSQVSIQAHDGQGLNSAVVTDASGAPLVAHYGTIGLTNVQIVYENGGWHIRGNVTGGTAGQTVINIVSTISGVNGQTSTVENADGSFDIGISIGPGSGGTISITAKDNAAGSTSDDWEGVVG